MPRACNQFSYIKIWDLRNQDFFVKNNNFFSMIREKERKRMGPAGFEPTTNWL